MLKGHRVLFFLLVLLLLCLLSTAGCTPGLEKDSLLTGEKSLADLPAAGEGMLLLHFIDVGQADAILIESPAQTVLIDGGNRNSPVLAYLQKRGIDGLDLVIGTHPHADHIGGLIEILSSLPVGEIMDPAVVHTTKTFEAYLEAIDHRNIPFTEGRRGLTRHLGEGITMEVLHPETPSSRHLNNASIVTRITHGKMHFLLTGDLEEHGEKELLLCCAGQLPSTVLKVGHHGSSTSTTSPFLQAVNPEIAVLSLGMDNSYGFPHDEVLQSLEESGARVYRTDIHGTVVIVSDGQKLDVFLEKW